VEVVNIVKTWAFPRGNSLEPGTHVVSYGRLNIISLGQEKQSVFSLTECGSFCTLTASIRVALGAGAEVEGAFPER
jgi:hypothetical protein